MSGRYGGSTNNHLMLAQLLAQLQRLGQPNQPIGSTENVLVFTHYATGLNKW
jgi:hypothetical protein